MGPRREASQPLADGVYLGQPYLVRWDEGRLPEVADYIVSSPWERTLDRAFACHAYAHVAASPEAQRLLTGLAARGFADVHYDGFWLTVMSLVAAALGRTADADEAFAPAAAVHERMDAPIWTARTRLEWGGRSSPRIGGGASACWPWRSRGALGPRPRHRRRGGRARRRVRRAHPPQARTQPLPARDFITEPGMGDRFKSAP